MTQTIFPFAIISHVSHTTIIRQFSFSVWQVILPVATIHHHAIAILIIFHLTLSRFHAIIPMTSIFFIRDQMVLPLAIGLFFKLHNAITMRQSLFVNLAFVTIAIGIIYFLIHNALYYT